MTKTESSSLQKVGYLTSLPEGADSSDYESIIIKNKKGERIIMYRLISETKISDDIENFSSSWKVYESYL